MKNIGDRGEVNETLSRYGLFTTGTIDVLTDICQDVYKLSWFLNNGELVDFERPDAYIKINNEVLIIEHFRIDSYESHPKHGSKLLRNEKALDDNFARVAKNTNSIMLSNPIGIMNSYEFFIDNCKTRFQHHYDQIEHYKNRLRSEKIANERTVFKVCFLMDEVSPLGTLTHNGEKIVPVNLGRSKVFLDFFSQKPEVDWIISAVVMDKGYRPYFFSQAEILTLRRKTIDYSKYQFLGGNTMRLDIQFPYLLDE